MRTPTGAPQSAGLAGRLRLSTSPPGAVRSLLLTELEAQTDAFARWSAALATGLPGDPSGLERATAALRMCAARLVIEEIGDALAGVDAGRYGTCTACDRPIELARLHSVPWTRRCAACPPSAPLPAERSAVPRPGPSR